MNSVQLVGASLTEKPWGSEYLVCRSSTSALWCLLINCNASTSFHCHPLKRTGYVVLRGSVQIDFLSGTRTLGSGEFINFRPGLFHKTTALTDQAVVLEIESPDCKQDLLRLEDVAGRDSSMIERPASAQNRTELFLIASFQSMFADNAEVDLCDISASYRNIKQLASLSDKAEGAAFLMVMDGVAFTNKSYLMSEPQRLLGPGDVISVHNLLRMRSVIDEVSLNVSGIIFEKIK